MEIKNISSPPEYITDFIKTNSEKLNEIYKEGIEVDSGGLLFCKCSMKENNIDVAFLKEKELNNFIAIENWKKYKETIPENKKIIYIIDVDLECSFLIEI